ncbi:MAG: 50S ribosomal protein L15 [Bacilli bacterium]|jgi:large subunit ribosomal protein L15|nr:50S ribosomal protein L15 [Bacilli bacterium]
MELNNLKIAQGSRHLPKRVGQGIGSGMGKTSTRGQKGQGARQGRKVPVGFEGGQLPLFRRVPKHGFTNYGRVEFAIVHIADLEGFEDGATVNDIALLFAGLIHDLKAPVKILGGAKLSKKLNVKVQAYTKSAKAAIEEVGGVAEVETIKEARIAFKKTLEDASAENEGE